jgi:hypothetical protein
MSSSSAPLCARRAPIVGFTVVIIAAGKAENRFGHAIAPRAALDPRANLLPRNVQVEIW